MRKITIFILLAFLLVFCATPAYAQPALPHAFYGSVTINGNAAADGTRVSAKVDNGTVIPTQNPVTTSGGNYGIGSLRLLVQGDIKPGAAITFYVNGVEAEGVTAVFEAGAGPTLQDLTVSATPPSLVTSAASSVTTSRATLNGSLSTLGTALSVEVSFEWGRTTAYGTETTPQTMNATGSFSFSLSGLSSDTTYHFRSKAVGDGSPAYGGNRTFTTGRVAVGGGGGGVGAPPLPEGTTDVRGVVDTGCCFTKSATAVSDDELCTLTIPEDTVGLTEELACIARISMVIMDEPPDPPEDADIVGLAYDFQPSGATFDPSIILEYTYDPDDIPEGVAEEDLVIAMWDEEAGEWVELEGCVIDTKNNTITASVSHFTTFAIIARAPPPPAPAPTPPTVVAPAPPAPPAPPPAPPAPVAPPPTPEVIPPFNWALLGGIIGVVVATILLIFILMRKESTLTK